MLLAMQTCEQICLRQTPRNIFEVTMSWLNLIQMNEISKKRSCLYAYIL